MKYNQVVQWSAEGDGIALEMLGDDQQPHRFEVGFECAGVLAAALAAEVARRGVEGKDQQLIRPTGMQLATTQDGQPMIIFTINGGVELPLVFKPESVGVLVTQLENLMGHIQSGSQVRWR